MRKLFFFILFAFSFIIGRLDAQELDFEGQDYSKYEQDYLLEGLAYKGYEIVNVENYGVQSFIDDRAYDNKDLVGNYNFSVVKKYSKGYPSKPAGIRLNWNSDTPIENISKVVVKLFESNIEEDDNILDFITDDENIKLYYPDVNNRQYLLCNMSPHKYYYYKIEEIDNTGQTKILKKGKFYTHGLVRMLRVDGMVNVRDFGGWPTSFGMPVEYGRIFRGNRPEGITPTGKNDFVRNEHITADLDLRGNNLGKSPLGPNDKVEYYCTNNQRYKLALVGQSGRGALAKDIKIIADVLSRGGNVFLHCNHGANRAGTLAFLIQGILGLSEADLSREYELSSFAYGLSRNKALGEMLPEIRSYGRNGDDLAQCFYNFARSIGVEEKTLDTIRCVMLGFDMEDMQIKNAHKYK